MLTPVRYPTGGEYREALFDTKRAFKDPALVGGAVTMDPLGMPKPISGASGSVFTVRSADGRRWAVKCFTRFVDHQAVRYQRISGALRAVNKPWRVEFEYLPDGVLCGGSWYPILKMEWVEATGLIPYIEKHLWEPRLLADLAGKFVRMVEDLATLGIAHGDLQHGNLLITSSGELKLIDYDGMFVPSLTQMGACEIGHVNYQSPARMMSTWGPYLDNFSTWIIYCSLVAITIDPTLWSVLRNQGDEALLFHRADYDNPRNSRALLALTQSSKPDLEVVGRLMNGLWTPDVAAIPPLDLRALPKPSEQALPSVPAPSRGTATTATAPSGPIPDWVTQVQGSPQAPVSNVPGSSSWVTGHLPPLAPVAFSPSRLALRLLACLALAAIMAAGFLAGLGELPEIAAGAASSLIIMSYMLTTMILFRRMPEWQAKHEKVVLFKARASESSKANREVAKLEAVKRDINTREKKTVAKITKQADKARAAEQKELAGVDRRLASQIQKLEKQKHSLQSSEARETANALRLLQDQHVNSRLRGSSVSSAGIPGIGPGVARSLAANGITTAADFTGIASSTGPRGGTSQVMIRLRNGSYVHPTGVGQKKASDLDAWRRTLEMRAKATQPSVLPPTQAQAITAKYAQQRQSIDNQEKALRAQASNEQRQISQKWISTHTPISAELLATRQAFAQERAQAHAQQTIAKKQADATAWQRDLATREVAAYRNVSYRRYLAGVISS